MMILIPLVGTLASSPWLTVLLVGTIAVAWMMLLAAWVALDRGESWWM